MFLTPSHRASAILSFCTLYTAARTCLGVNHVQNSCPDTILNGCNFGPTSYDVLYGYVTSYPTPQVPSAAYGIFSNHSDVSFPPLGSHYTKIASASAISIEQCCVNCQTNGDCGFWSFKPRYPVTLTDGLGYCYQFNSDQCHNTASGSISLFSYDDDATKASASFAKCAQCPPVPAGIVHLPACTPYVEPTRGTWTSCPDYASTCAIAPTSSNLPTCIGGPLVNYAGEYVQGTLDKDSAVVNPTGVTIEQCVAACIDVADQCSAFSWKQTGATTGDCVVYDLSVCYFDDGDSVINLNYFDSSKQNAYTFHAPCA